MKQRRLEPELLDSLPHDDPGAVRSRADLRLINHLMGNYRWIERHVIRLASSLPEPPNIVEIGAGCGTLAVRLHRRLPRMRYQGIDLAPRPADLPASFQWLQQDLLTVPFPAADLVIANLFLHHFDSEQLRTIGMGLRQSCQHAMIFSEPARRYIHLYGGKLLALTGIHAITRHDMAISIRAGFLKKELAADLGCEADDAWITRHHQTWLGAYRMIATRIEVS